MGRDVEEVELTSNGARPQGTSVIAIIGATAAAPINNIGRSISSLSRDIGKIAESVRVLPAIYEALSSIERHTVSLESDVREMRASVDQIHGEINSLTNHVDDLETSLHPIGRLRSRLRREESEPGAGEPASRELEAGADQV